MKNKIVQEKINELKEKISEKRFIPAKKRDWVIKMCKFCKEHHEDCFCDYNSELELKGMAFVIKNEKENENIQI